MLYPALNNKLDSINNQEWQFSEERTRAILALANYISGKYLAGQTPNLNFICTHNSRRSHLGQFWGKAIPCYLNLPQSNTFSGGTEITACHPNTLSALERVGAIITCGQGTNPVSNVWLGNNIRPIKCWSKQYDDAANPGNSFAAILTCSSADEACPFIPGAEARISMPFTDPKYADNSPEEQTAYDQTSEQIAATLLEVFKQVKLLIQ